MQKSIKLTGFLFTLWGCVSLFSPLEGVFAEKTIGCKLLGGILIVFVVFLICSIVSTICCLYSVKECVLTSSSKYSVYVQYGNIYSPSVVSDGYDGRINLVIPVNRCFDTIIDDNLISHQTQHGRVMQELYDSRLYTPKTLNLALERALEKYEVENTLTVAEKPEGNLKRYEVGTVAELQVSDKLTYFFLGLSKINSMLQANTTKAEYAAAIQKLIEYCNQRSQGYPVVMPIIGTGLSRTNIDIADTLKFMINAFKINRDIINCDFHIVVWEGDKELVSIKKI